VGQTLEIPEVGDDTGLAASSPATDGRRVYALFATGEVAGIGLDGTQLWGASVGPFENAYGHASSLVVHEDRLLLQLDQGLQDEELSRLLALDVLTGETVWEVARPVDASWSTPLVIRHEDGSAEVILSATPWVISYDAREGTELWRVDFMQGEVVPAPVSTDDLVLVLHQDVGGAAIRLGGRGDVTDTHVAWTLDYGAPSISSPALSGGLLFIQEDDGLVSCYQAGDGVQLWEHELDGRFTASPVIVGERLYLTNTRGTTFTLKVGREVEELGRSELGEGVHSSFAFAGGRLFIRGEKHLFAIGAPGP
jgi:outer membrane protein assembly factor BamB